MDTKLATRNYRLQQWMEIFRDRANSGLSIRRYCEENGISRNAYFYWLKVARQAAVDSSEQTKFVELKAPENLDQSSTNIPCTFSPQLTITDGHFMISLDRDTPRELLAMALEVISDAE